MISKLFLFDQPGAFIRRIFNRSFEEINTGEFVVVNGELAKRSPDSLNHSGDKARNQLVQNEIVNEFQNETGKNLNRSPGYYESLVKGK